MVVIVIVAVLVIMIIVVIMAVLMIVIVIVAVPVIVIVLELALVALALGIRRLFDHGLLHQEVEDLLLPHLRPQEDELPVLLHRGDDSAIRDHVSVETSKRALVLRSVSRHRRTAFRCICKNESHRRGQASTRL